MNLNKYFDRTYDEKKYNCLHFAAEIWKELTGKDLIGLMDEITTRKLHKTDMQQFEYLSKPISPCIVLMKRRRCTPHVGIFFQDRVIHLTELGVECFPLDIASRGFNKVSFIR